MNIKTTIAAVFIATMPLTAQAQDEQASCGLIGDIAEVIMQNRQIGVKMSEMMEIADGNELVEALITDAYSGPRYTTEQGRNRSAVDFRNEVELLCYGA